MMIRKTTFIPLISMIGASDTPRMQTIFLIENLTSKQFRFISEIAHNLLKGNIPLTDKTKRMIKPYVRQIRGIGDVKKPIAKRRLSSSIRAIKALIKIALPHVLKVFDQSKALDEVVNKSTKEGEKEAIEEEEEEKEEEKKDVTSHDE